MAKRKGLSNKIRFEVFKRDSFKCQYCGKAAPDIILHVDHINPVSKGGVNNIMNLITSCVACNFGKGAIKIDDNSALSKQKKQLDELSERRNQIQMMIDWREGLDNINKYRDQEVVEYVKSRFHCSLTDIGKQIISKALIKNSFEDVLEAIGRCETTYIEKDNNGINTAESIDKAIRMISGVANMLKVDREDPSVRKILYIRGIIRNRCTYVPKDIYDKLTKLINHGVDPDELTAVAKVSRNWTHFWDEAIGLVEDGDYES